MAAMPAWDSTSVKATLRITAQRLGQLQRVKDTHGQVVRREIADLLQQGNASQARAKAQILLREEANADLIEILEMHIGVILERFRELEVGKATTPVFIEAAGSIIVAAPSVALQDLSVVHDILAQRLGHQFVHSAVEQQNGYVSPRVLRIISSPSPSAATMNEFLHGIAASHDISWVSEPLREDIRDLLFRIMDPVGSHIVDLSQLRHICGQGIPDDPSWLRPRVWKLFLGNLSASKASWSKDLDSQRKSYYDLVQRLLPTVAASLEDQPSTSDGNLLTFASLLLNLPTQLSSVLVDEPVWLKTSPLSRDAEADGKNDLAGILDSRVASLLRNHLESNNQKLRAEAERLERINSARLFNSKFSGNDDIHYAHFSALLRILFLHSCLHPMKPPPYLPSVLIPLYCVFMKEQGPADLAHTEADTFWAFQSLTSEFADLYDQDGSRKWMRTLSEMLAVADKELAENLHAKGLDPALPHYSYPWFAGLLSQNLPLSSVFAVWDVLLSKPLRRRDSSLKLDLLVDICTALLVRAKVPLMCLGKSDYHLSIPWVEEDLARRPPSPLRPWELSDAFSEGMALLQSYPVDTAGGIDSILQTARDISQRRLDDGKAQKANGMGLGGRLANVMWKGFTNQVSEEDEDSSPEEDPEDSSEEEVVEDGNETETPGLTSRLANTVWRGITNQSSMDPVDSPPSPLSPPHSPLASPLPRPEVAKEANPSSPGLWNYAEKLKDSDAAATLAKVSSNWRARAWDVWGSRSPKTSTPDMSSPMSTVSELPPRTKASPLHEHFPHASRRGSLPDINDDDAVPPRPAFFRLPRDSFLPQPRKGNSSTTQQPSYLSAHGGDSLHHMSMSSLSSILSNPKSPSPAAGPTASGSGPRPLLLNSHSLITSRTPASADSSVRSARTTPAHAYKQWSDIPIGHSTQASLSSLSSLSPSEAFFKPSKQSTTSRSDRESDAGGEQSKRVLLSRKSVSPMAPAYRASRFQWTSRTSGTTSDAGSAGRLGISSSRTSSIDSGKRDGTFEWSRSAEQWDSPTSASSPMRPVTPPNQPPSTSNDLVDNSKEIQSIISMPAIATSITSLDPGDDTSDSATSRTPSKSARPRFRRSSRPPTIRTGDSLRSELTNSNSISPNSLSAPDDHDVVLTPRAEEFDSSRPTSPPLMLSQEAVVGAPSANGKSSQQHGGEQPARPRKASYNRSPRRGRDSIAEDGDDEGYDDLLSAYESEESGN